MQKKWWNIGLQLHVSNDTLHVIKNDPKLKTMEEQLREMLDGRIKQGDLTWDEVVEALEDNTVKEKELAKTIRNKYINPQPSMSELKIYFLPTKFFLVFFPQNSYLYLCNKE